MPPSFNLVLSGRAGSARASAEIHEYSWSEPHKQTYCDDLHRIDMVLSQRPPRAQGRFVNEPDRSSHPIGSIIFLPSRTVMRSEWAAGKQRCVCCLIDPALLRDDGGAHLENVQGALDVREPFVRASMIRLAQEATAPGFGSDLLVETLCMTLLLDLQRIRGKPAHGQLSRAELGKLDSLIRIDGQLPDMQALARHVGMSERHLARLFRATTGQSLSAYASECRLERAAALLCKPDLQIKQIAWMCGFASPSAFSAAFTRRMGAGPREYRAKRLT